MFENKFILIVVLQSISSHNSTSLLGIYSLIHLTSTPGPAARLTQNCARDKAASEGSISVIRCSRPNNQKFRIRIIRSLA